MFFSSENTQDWEQCSQNVQMFHDIARFECFADLNLFEYSFNVIQHWEMDALFDGAYFLLAVMVKGDERSQLRIAN